MVEDKWEVIDALVVILCMFLFLLFILIIAVIILLLQFNTALLVQMYRTIFGVLSVNVFVLSRYLILTCIVFCIVDYLFIYLMSSAHRRIKLTEVNHV